MRSLTTWESGDVSGPVSPTLTMLLFSVFHFTLCTNLALSQKKSSLLQFHKEFLKNLASMKIPLRNRQFTDSTTINFLIFHCNDLTPIKTLTKKIPKSLSLLHNQDLEPFRLSLPGQEWKPWSSCQGRRWQWHDRRQIRQEGAGRTQGSWQA